MQLTATGTAINFAQGTQSPFTMSFNLAGGTSQSAGCDSALMNASITDFSAVIGGQAIAEPASFLGNMTVSPYPTCAGLQQVEITNAASGSAANWLTVSYANNPANPAAHSTFTGNIGNYYIASGSYTVSNTTSAPELSLTEPSGLALLACAIAILLGRKLVIARA